MRDSLLVLLCETRATSIRNKLFGTIAVSATSNGISKEMLNYSPMHSLSRIRSEKDYTLTTFKQETQLATEKFLHKKIDAVIPENQIRNLNTELIEKIHNKCVVNNEQLSIDQFMELYETTQITIQTLI